MTSDELIYMARKAGFQVRLKDDGSVLYIENLYSPDDCEAPLQRFAALVAAAEREACAQICDDEHYSWLRSDSSSSGAAECAAAIRARPEHIL